ncbi:hypothetical protein Hokovirus_1_88 [Hokovirus HKV1]|uniref:Uncharacterized protein n=1 Tax=Hokovirus HKV1 TaxID=1977638 RepID=A0A1V0SER0_9VIRU|nr:hypothetical protein Hokovirus_1_88 [Hokovirus HKV1]
MESIYCLWNNKSKSTNNEEIINNEPNEPVKEYDINNMTIDEIKNIIKNVNESDKKNICKNLLDIRDHNKFELIYDNLCPKIHLHMIVDNAIEEGNLEMTKLLILKYNASYSLYAKQCAIINKNYKTAFFADAFGKVRNNTGIHTVHGGKKGWSDNIPEKYRYI